MRHVHVVTVVAFVGVTACAKHANVRSSDEIAADYKARLAEARERHMAEVVVPICGDPRSPPQARCGLVVDEMKTPAFVESFVATTCGGHDDDACGAAFRDEFLRRTKARYPRATADAVDARCAARPGLCENLSGVEIAALAAHNDAVFDELDKESAAIIAEHGTAQEQAAQQRAENERARRTAKAILGGVAAGLNSASQSLQRQNATSPSPNMRAASRSCRSDPDCGSGRCVKGTLDTEGTCAAKCSSRYDCEAGSQCVKNQFETDGICAVAVDEHGRPLRPSTPPPASFGPGGSGDCSFDTQCPVGFKCVKGDALRGHCMK